MSFLNLTYAALHEYHYYVVSVVSFGLNICEVKYKI